MSILNQIPTDLKKLCEYDRTKDYIGISITMNSQGIGYHSGIIICSDEIIYHFHFTGQMIYEEFGPVVPNNIYIKELKILNTALVTTYKAIAEIIYEDAVIDYGIVFDKSFFKPDGSYYATNGIPNVVTCVGFCIKVISAFLYNQEEYLNVDDWDTTSLESIENDLPGLVEYTIDYLNQVVPGLSDELLQTLVKRIRPSELTSSAFYNSLPVAKGNIDTIRPAIENYLLAEYLAS